MRGSQADTFSVPTRILFIGLAAALFTIGMRELASILLPILFSLFATVIFAPLIQRLQKRGINPALSIALVILLFLMIVAGIGFIVINALLDFNVLIPVYQSRLTEALNSLGSYIPSIENLSLGSIIRDIGLFLLASVASIFTGTVSAATTVGLIVITTMFLLIDAVGISKKVQREVEEHFVLAANFKGLSHNFINFMVIRTETNLVMGIGTAVILLIGNIEFAILWGFLAFLLGYIPYVGLLFATIPPALLALLQYGPLGALAVIAGIMIINALSENLVFPSLAGKGLELSPSVIFLSLIYWGFVFGPAGALLSTPLTMVVRTILESFEETHWIAQLMGESKKRENLKK